MKNRLYTNETNNKLTSLFYSGAGLIAFAFTSLFMLAADKLMPLINGSLITDMFPGADESIRTGLLAIFGTVFGVLALSYLVMALLGANAIKMSKSPEKVKAHPAVALFLAATGVLSLLCVATGFEEGASLMDNIHPVLFSLTHIVFAISYIFEVKSVKKDTAALCA